jgi:addiction module RelB/DinJ family antitoxin
MKTIISIKADKETKESAQKVAAELGLPLSTVVNAYLKQFVRNKSVYLSLSPTMTSELAAIISGAEQDLRQNKNISPAFSSARAMDKYLDA